MRSRAGESATPRKVRTRGSGTIKPSIFTLNTVCLRERKKSKHGDGQERGKARRKAGDIYYDFNWTLCLFSDCCSRLPSLVGPSKFRNTPRRTFAVFPQPLPPCAEFPARRVTVRLRASLQPLSRESHPSRERIFHFIRRGHRSRSLRSVSSEPRVLVNIISWPSTCIALRACQRRDPPRCTTLPLICSVCGSSVGQKRCVALMLYSFMIRSAFAICRKAISKIAWSRTLPKVP